MNFTALGDGALEGALANRLLRVEAVGASGSLLHRASAGDAWAPLCAFSFVPSGPSSLLSSTGSCTWAVDKAGWTLASDAGAFRAHRVAAPAATFFSNMGTAGRFGVIAVLLVVQGVVRYAVKRVGLFGQRPRARRPLQRPPLEAAAAAAAAAPPQLDAAPAPAPKEAPPPPAEGTKKDN